MKKLLLLIPLVVFIVGCDGGEEGNGYFPLAVGNKWDYSLTQTTTMTLPDTTFVMTGASTTEITDETTLDNGTEVFQQITTTTYDDTLMQECVDTTYIEKLDTYILIYDDKADTDPDTSLLLPIEEGNTWTVYSDSADTMTAEVLGKEDMTVPAGTYEDCWKIEYTFTGATNTDWFAPDFGIVKHEMVIIDTAMTIEFTKDLENVTIQ